MFEPQKLHVQIVEDNSEGPGGTDRGPGWQNLGSVKDRGQAGKITRHPHQNRS